METQHEPWTDVCYTNMKILVASKTYLVTRLVLHASSASVFGLEVIQNIFDTSRFICCVACMERCWIGLYTAPCMHLDNGTPNVDTVELEQKCESHEKANSVSRKTR